MMASSLSKPLHPVAHSWHDVDPFPKPGTKWQPLHKTPHGNNKTISIRRFIARDNEMKKI